MTRENISKRMLRKAFSLAGGFLRPIVWLHLIFHRMLLQCVQGSGSMLRRRLLIEFLRTDHLTSRQFIAKLAIPEFGGFHPKNVFNYRSEFFLHWVRETDKVLDVACGTGAQLKQLASAVQSGIGIELNNDKLELCRGRAPVGNLEFLHGDILEFDYEKLRTETGYTVAVFSHILEDIKEPVLLIRTVAAQRVLICVPSAENWKTQLKIHYGLPYLTDPTHFREYTREHLVKELTESGYGIEYIGFNPEGEIICAAER